MRLLPSLDLRDGQCVRLLHGDFDAPLLTAPTMRKVCGGFE